MKPYDKSRSPRQKGAGKTAAAPGPNPELRIPSLVPQSPSLASHLMAHCCLTAKVETGQCGTQGPGTRLRDEELQPGVKSRISISIYPLFSPGSCLCSVLFSPLPPLFPPSNFHEFSFVAPVTSTCCVLLEVMVYTYYLESGTCCPFLHTCRNSWHLLTLNPSLCLVLPKVSAVDNANRPLP